MAELQSAGVSVTLIDESFYPESAGGEGVLIFAATRKGKRNTNGGVAAATLPSNSGVLTRFTSKGALNDAFGEAEFVNINGTPMHGHETNEYGIHGAYQALASINNVSVVTADIDLAQLEGSATEPTQDVYGGTHWFDISNSSFGLRRWSAITNSWEPVEVTILNDKPGEGNLHTVQNGSAKPRSTYGANGDFVVVTSVTPLSIFHKESGIWVMLGAENAQNDFQFAPHTRVPTTRWDESPLEEGDLYVQVTSPNGGAYFDFSSFDSDLGQFIYKDAPIYALTDAATSYYINRGELSEGVIFVQSDSSGILTQGREVNPAFPQNSGGVAAFSPKRHNGNTVTTSTSRVDIPVIQLNTHPASSVLINGELVTFDASCSSDTATITAADMASKLQDMPEMKRANIRVELVGNKRLKLINTKGFDITVQNVGPVNDGTNGGWSPLTMDDVAAVMGFGYNVDTFDLFRETNWEDLEYIADTSTPTREVDLETLWYATDLRAEFLQSYFDVSSNSMKWRTFAFTEDTGTNGLSNKVAIRGSAPTAPNNKDLWIDTSDMDNYPVIKQYRSGSWVTLDNSDTTTTNGVLFGNYAYEAPYNSDGVERSQGSVFSQYAPDAAQYPEGILLFNMDYSTNNVKEYVGNGSWITVSGVKANGAPYMGRKAVRNMVVKSLKRAIITNKRARARNNHFYLLACPGYPEVLPELISLNAERKYTGFVVGSTPMRLKADANQVFKWANNEAKAMENGEDGRVTYSNMAASWAFAGIQSDQKGNMIAVPSDIMALQTILQSDNMSYQWFAPAGDTRGVVPDTTAIGHVEGNSFVVTDWDEGLMDTLYTNSINPIIQFEGEPIKVYGQKTITDVASAMDRINVARLTAYLRYRLERMVRPFLFEPNDAQTREAVRNMVEGFLADIVSKRGIADFVVQCDEGNNTPLRIDRNELYVDIAIVPMKVVEFIYIPVRLKNTGAI